MMTDHTVTTEAIEEPKKYTVNCELPGLTIKDVAVEIDPEQRVLHISAKRDHRIAPVKRKRKAMSNGSFMSDTLGNSSVR